MLTAARRRGSERLDGILGTFYRRPGIFSPDIKSWLAAKAGIPHRVGRPNAPQAFTCTSTKHGQLLQRGSSHPYRQPTDHLLAPPRSRMHSIPRSGVAVGTNVCHIIVHSYICLFRVTYSKNKEAISSRHLIFMTIRRYCHISYQFFIYSSAPPPLIYGFHSASPQPPHIFAKPETILQKLPGTST
jgi:hypothetical protein